MFLLVKGIQGQINERYIHLVTNVTRMTTSIKGSSEKFEQTNIKTCKVSEQKSRTFFKQTF